MRVRIAASLLFALAGAFVLYVSLQARATELRRQVLQSAAAAGSPAVAPRTPADAHLAALAAFRSYQKHTTPKAAGPRAAMIATVQQAVRKALAAGQPAAQRSQLENLAGVLDQELAGLGGNRVSAHNQAAAHWLQRAVLDDDTNADAKFNLQLLMSQDPQSARKQPQRPAGGQSKSKVRKGNEEGTRNEQSRSPKPRVLGEGF